MLEKALVLIGKQHVEITLIDLIARGVIDPAKVVRTALQDASSVAGLLITTEAMVAEKPKKESPMPAGGPGGGGMGGMGDMGDMDY